MTECSGGQVQNAPGRTRPGRAHSMFQGQAGGQCTWCIVAGDACSSESTWEEEGVRSGGLRVKPL